SIVYNALHTLTAPLVPYTTLFRSGLHAGGIAARYVAFGIEAERQVGGNAGLAQLGSGEGDVQRLRIGRGDLDDVEAEFGGLVDRDRKSTRLNSSHVKISYAVFCLK